MNSDLRSWACTAPKRLAVRIDGVDTRYGQLEALASQVAHVLRAAGVQKGSHVALILGNDMLVFAMVWGAYRLGAYMTPIPSTASVEDAAYIVRDSGAQVVIASAALGANVAALPGLFAPGSPVFLGVHGAMPGYREMEPALRAACTTPISDECSGTLMMYTSGTTGKPPGRAAAAADQRQCLPRVRAGPGADVRHRRGLALFVDRAALPRGAAAFRSRFPGRGRNRQRPGSVGRAKKGQFHVLGDDDQELAPGHTGRVFFSGVALFFYHNAPEKTAARTSRQGYLFRTDRLDDMIICGGVNSYPQEIESALTEMPQLAEAAVIGAAPDAEFGERPVAFVVPRATAQDPAALIEAIAAFFAARLGRIKRPKEINLLQSLPFSAQGKLLRRELRRSLQESAHG